MLHELLHLMTNPAHLMFEVLTDIVFDVLLVGLIWPLALRRLHREHEVIDAEHGVDHDLAAEPCHHNADARKCWVFKNCNRMPAEAIIAVDTALDTEYWNAEAARYATTNVREN